MQGKPRKFGHTFILQLLFNVIVEITNNDYILRIYI